MESLLLDLVKEKGIADIIACDVYKMNFQKTIDKINKIKYELHYHRLPFGWIPDVDEEGGHYSSLIYIDDDRSVTYHYGKSRNPKHPSTLDSHSHNRDTFLYKKRITEGPFSKKYTFKTENHPHKPPRKTKPGFFFRIKNEEKTRVITLNGDGRIVRTEYVTTPVWNSLWPLKLVKYI